MLQHTAITYTIDAADRISAVNAAWKQFALENGGEHLAEGIIGTELWGHITDATVCDIYRILTTCARSGQSVRFCYRCDAPAQRRTFEMTLKAAPQGEVEFSSKLIRAEARPAVRLLEGTAMRNDQLIRVCGWCQRVAVGPKEWAEVEEAVNKLDLLHQERLPGLTHGICAGCAKNFLSET